MGSYFFVGPKIDGTDYVLQVVDSALSALLVYQYKLQGTS